MAAIRGCHTERLSHAGSTSIGPRVGPRRPPSRPRTCSLAAMRPSPLLFPIVLALPLLGCAADDGFRARLAQGCRSEMECAQLAAQADARAGTCPSTTDPNVVLRVRLDIGSSAPPCDEVEEDRRVAHGYLDGFTQERERQAAGALQRETVRREEEQARREAERDQQRTAAEADQRQREEEAWAAQRPLSCANGESEPACDELRSFLAATPRGAHAAEARAALDSHARFDMQKLEAQRTAEREERERAAHAATDSAPRSTPVVPATPAPRDTGGHVCCCDGTVSPTCTTVHRGCCSHHQGVCACD
jgi:hypothetical protein